MGTKSFYSAQHRRSGQAVFPGFAYNPLVKRDAFMFVALTDENPQQRAFFWKYHICLT
jgi:hypothetical protein